MRKHLLLVVSLLAIVAVNAQSGSSSRKIRLGFKLDPVFSNTLKPNDKGTEKDGSKFGLSYGIMAEIPLDGDDRMALSTGVEVAMTGGKISYIGNGAGPSPSDNVIDNPLFTGQYPQHFNFNLQYIQIPVAIKLKTNFKNKLAYWGQFGGYVGFPIRARMSYDVTGTPISDEKVKAPGINPINIGMLIGAGVEYKLDDKTTLVGGLGFENGFIDVTKQSTWHDGKVNLNRWALRLGIFF